MAKETFFRRHHRLFLILMGLGVIGFVFVGSWRHIEDKIHDLWGSPRLKTKVAHIGDRTVTLGEIVTFRDTLQADGRIVRFWALNLLPVLTEDAATQQKAGGILNSFIPPYDPYRTPFYDIYSEDPGYDRVLSWMALYEDARRLGLGATDGDVESRIRALQDLGLGEGFVQEAAGIVGGERRQLVEALKIGLTLNTYHGWLVRNVSMAVEPELRRDYARLADRLKARLVVLEPEAFVDEVDEPSDEAVRDHFNEYKVYLPGDGPHGYGYRTPDSVKLEYLAGRPEGFLAQAAEAVTEAEVRAYYDAHKDTESLEPAPEEETQADEDAEDGEEASDKDEDAADDEGDEAADEADAEEAEADADAGDDEAPTPRRPRPFAEVRDEILRKLVRERAAELARRHLETVVDQIRRKRQQMPLAPYADGERIALEQIGEFRTAAELAEMPGLGEATHEGRLLAEDAVRLVELVPDPSQAVLAQGEMSPVYAGPEGRSFAFRVTAVRPSRPPASVDPVREEVVADLKRLKAFEENAREAGRALVQEAAEKGLEAAAEAKDYDVVTTPFFPRKDIEGEAPWLPGVGRNDRVVAECFQMEADGVERRLISLDDARKVLVVELADRERPTEQGFAAERSLVAFRAAWEAGRDVLGRVYTDEFIHARFGIAPIKAAAEDEAEEGQ